MIGGHSAIANNVTLPDFTEALGMSGIVKGPLKKGKRIIGAPAIDHLTWKRMHAYLLGAVKKKK
jgi:UDP-3-O-[3-hydroxymyristoyl] glucosamine N-acyltransferase